MELSSHISIKPKKKYSARISMGLIDYERIGEILKELTYHSLKTKTNDLTSINKFWAFLDELYINIDSVIPSEKRDILNVKLENIGKRIFNFLLQSSSSKMIIIPFDLIKELRDVQIELMRLKQDLNMGIEMEEKSTEEDKMKRAFGLETN